MLRAIQAAGSRRALNSDRSRARTCIRASDHRRGCCPTGPGWTWRQTGALISRPKTSRAAGCNQSARSASARSAPRKPPASVSSAAASPAGSTAGCEGPLTTGLCRNTRRRRSKKRSSPVAGKCLSLTDDERPRYQRPPAVRQQILSGKHDSPCCFGPISNFTSQTDHQRPGRTRPSRVPAVARQGPEKVSKTAPGGLWNGGTASHRRGPRMRNGTGQDRCPSLKEA